MIIPKDNGYYNNFQGHDRFDVPEPLYRVTGGYGGESYLIVGSEKAALYDCGMACFSRELISNIHEILDPLGRKLDCVLMSHTHYDHIGALPYILKEWPDAVVHGAKKAIQVFSSEEAKETMRELGNNADSLYETHFGPVSTDGLRIDKVLKDGDEVDLGDHKVVFYESKGHTDCSASYMLLPEKILFLSESIGQFERPGSVATSCLKSFAQSIESAKRMADLKPERIISMHYGILPKDYNEEYFDLYIKEAQWEWMLIRKCISKGMTDEEVSDVHDIFYWNPNKELLHPYEAHHLNTMIIIRRIRREMEARNGKL